MQRLQAFKYELRPNGEQELQMHRFAGACRFVFNRALALQKERYEGGEKKLGYALLCKALTAWRHDTQHEARLRRYQPGLNKAILDQGWFEFRRQLDYKLAWNGGLLIAVPPQNTSRTCPVCGHVSADNRKTQAVFRCVACGYEGHADHVGAMNILARGHCVAACGEAVSQARPARARRAASVKQEPTEATESGVMPLRAAGIPGL